MKKTTAVLFAIVAGMFSYNAYSAAKMEAGKEIVKDQTSAGPATETAVREQQLMMAWDTESINWKPSTGALPAGAQVAVLEGDPSKEGFFSLRAKLPAGYKIPPHWHSGNERITVLEGTFSLGMGEKWDDKLLKDHKMGAYLSMPAGMKHFAMTKESTTIQLNTLGPWSLTYVNASDDPRNQKTVH